MNGAEIVKNVIEKRHHFERNHEYNQNRTDELMNMTFFKALDREHTPSFRQIGIMDFVVSGLVRTSAI